MTQINFAAHLASISRKVVVETVGGVELRTVVIRQPYPTTVEDLWEACTTSERLARWFIPVSGDLVVGGQFQFEGNAGGTIQECRAPEFLRASWEFEDRVSWVELRFTSAGNSALLELRHISPLTDFWTQYGPGAVGLGWDLGLSGLNVYLHEGEAFDRAAAEAAAMGPDGMQALVTSAEAWHDAAVAGGEDPVWAREATQRTIAAYTATEAGS